MPSFVIASKRSEMIESPVFYAGEDGTEEAVLVFTDRRRAEKYVEAAGWSTDYEVRDLSSVELLQWIMHAYQQGTQYVSINPKRSTHTSGDPQSVIVIEEHLARYAEQLTDAVLDTAFSASSST